MPQHRAAPLPPSWLTRKCSAQFQSAESQVKHSVPSWPGMGLMLPYRSLNS